MLLFKTTFINHPFLSKRPLLAPKTFALFKTSPCTHTSLISVKLVGKAHTQASVLADFYQTHGKFAAFSSETTKENKRIETDAPRQTIISLYPS